MTVSRDAESASGAVGSSSTGRHRSSNVIVALCFAALICDGYDLVVYGATVPSLLGYEPWGVTAMEAGAIGSFTLVGMLIGALASGAASGRFGPRRLFLGSMVWFATAMGLCAVAPSPEVFGVLRFIGGLGLGGFVPVSVALIIEFSPAGRRQFNNALSCCGYCLGGIAAAVAGIVLLPDLGFRWMYALCLLPLITVFPLALRYLPESPAYLASRGRVEDADAVARDFGVGRTGPASSESSDSASMRALLKPAHRRAAALFTVAAFCGLLMTYGISTWLPQIMKQAGYSLGSSLMFLLVLNAGAMVGVLIASTLADRLGSRQVTATVLLLAAVSILMLSFRMPLPMLYVFVAIAGLGTIGTQILIMGYVGTVFTGTSRAPAIGLTIGIGRAGAVVGPILGGWIAAATLGYQWNFYAFSVFAVIGMGAILLVSVGTSRRGNRDAHESVRSAITPN
ncbi:MFS transporter [Rhodococcus opacus]|uniref:Putative aromatic acid transporter n=1 Tax=Rhodococcus opacus (strain B4) TaxID=632772 RepID=C1B5C7_RHOOB|nr:MFS transporter [Rhodococcus opacus]BAH51053.1 putative aromatic acid transporter [Rhodococcus opacus B4]